MRKHCWLKLKAIEVCLIFFIGIFCEAGVTRLCQLSGSFVTGEGLADSFAKLFRATFSGANYSCIY
jgi:hypothetical protein